MHVSTRVMLLLFVAIKFVACAGTWPPGTTLVSSREPDALRRTLDAWVDSGHRYPGSCDPAGPVVWQTSDPDTWALETGLCPPDGTEPRGEYGRSICRNPARRTTSFLKMFESGGRIGYRMWTPGSSRRLHVVGVVRWLRLCAEGIGNTGSLLQDGTRAVWRPSDQAVVDLACENFC